MENIFKYMGWCDHNFDRFHKCRVCNKMANHSTLKIHYLDGNDMVLAINKMWDKGDWYKFQYYCEAIYEKGSEQLAANVWLFGNPRNFFELMEEWLSKK